MPRPVHFELPYQDVDRIKAFYESVFGWKFERWDGPMEYWMVSTGDPAQPGINGGIYAPTEDMHGVINTLDVADLDASLRLVEANNGRLLGEKMAIPGMGFLAYFIDPEGNVQGMMQADPTAGV